MANANIVTLQDEDGNDAYPRTLLSAVYDSNGVPIQINNTLPMLDISDRNKSLQEIIQSITTEKLPTFSTRVFYVHCNNGAFLCTLSSTDVTISGIAIPAISPYGGSIGNEKAYLINASYYGSAVSFYWYAELQYKNSGIIL